METVTIAEAMTRLSHWVDTAMAGKDVVIERDGQPVARITRLKPQQRVVRFGVLKGRLRTPADFDAPLPDDALACFGDAASAARTE